MASMFFGQYLLAKGIIGREALLDALRRQRDVNLNLAELGVREGMLSEDQARNIMLAFRTSDQSLDRICHDFGYLDGGQIEKLLAVQKREHLRIGDALVKGGSLTATQVAAHLTEFTREERLAEQRLQADFEAFGEQEAVTTSLELAAFHFARIAGQAVKMKGLNEAGGELAEKRIRYAQRIVGDKEFCIAVDLPDRLMHKLASGLLSTTKGVSDETARDAACEFVNLVAGNACTHLESAGYGVRPEPPFVSGESTPAQPAGPSLQASFTTEDADFEVHLFFKGKE